jgi:hypothetical protein
MNGFTLRQIAEILELEEEFVAALERESILFVDLPEPPERGADGPRFSVRMLERARVAHSLVDELEVNFAGVAVILRMREDVARLRRQLRIASDPSED